MSTSVLGDIRSEAPPIERGLRPVVTEADLDPLPATAQRYLRFMRVLGRPRDWSFQMSWKGRFRTAPTRSWMACEAWQYDSSDEIARISRIRIRAGGLALLTGRDTYLGGHGRMRGRLLGLFNVVDATGPELDVSELVTWLNDAVLFAPSMLLSPAVRWKAIDHRSFEVSITDAGRTVTARVLVDDRGAPRDFITSDRFLQDPDDPGHRWMRARWSTPLDGWTTLEGRPRPTGGKAVWHLPEGDFAYAEIDMASAELTYNVPPPS